MLRTYLRLQLAGVERRIGELEHTTETGWWRLVPGRPGRPGGILHRGDCALPGGVKLSLTEARIALDEQDVQACNRCGAAERLRAG